MKTSRRGFTLIEVMIFLAVTGLLFLVVTLGVQGSVLQQRRNDAVQSLAEFLRTAYSEAVNVMSEGSGNKEMAIYGRLVTIGESYDLSGAKLDNTNKMFAYNIVGSIKDTAGDGSFLQTLASLDVNVLVKNGEKYLPTGLIGNYTPKWSSVVQNSAGDEFKGAIMIVRHPRSGVVYTYVMEGSTIEVNQAVKNNTSNPLKNAINNFSIKQLDLCLSMDGEKGKDRADIRIVKDARNAAGVEIVTGENSACKGSGV